MLLHVCTEQEWKACASLNFYEPEGFLREGFIHCCLPDQLQGVLERYFSDRSGLLLLTIDELLLSSDLIFEASVGGENFPHVYGPINKSAIIKTEKLNHP